MQQQNENIEPASEDRHDVNPPPCERSTLTVTSGSVDDADDEEVIIYNHYMYLNKFRASSHFLYYALYDIKMVT